MDYLKEAMEIVKAQATTRPMTVTEMLSMAQELAAGMKAMAEGMIDTAVAAGAEASAPACDPAKSIKENSITCCECGKVFKLLSKKHLASHGLTKEEYKAKYGIKKTSGLSAKKLARDRKNKMQEMKLWERRGKNAGKKAAVAPAKPKKAASAKA
ncbi:MAG: MucR family transcriptional regulator [Proteobacteria bacterium]|nr:MucR family transcriptional regulator [Pseudomonadota bacterium]